jgi:hypothetical protein
MRMSVTEVEDDNCNMNMNMNMPDMGAACDTGKSLEQKAQDTINGMMKKANTTLEKAKEAVEKANVCDIELRG